jgi:hypothetical protein
MAITERYVYPQTETIRAAMERARMTVLVVPEPGTPAQSFAVVKPS